MIDWLKTHWFLLSAIVVAGAAWGEQKVKVENLTDAVKQQSIINTKVNDLSTQAARVDERTQLLLESQKRQEQLLMEIMTSIKQR